MSKITKNMFVPFLDVTKDTTFANPSWKQIDKSTIFEYAVGEQTEDFDYICYANSVTEVTENKPSLPQEIVIDKDNPIYNFLIAEIKALPVGDACLVPLLICFPSSAGKFESGADAQMSLVTLTDKTLNTVDGKITFTLNIYGDIEKGTYTVTDGVPSFVEPTP